MTNALYRPHRIDGIRGMRIIEVERPTIETGRSTKNSETAKYMIQCHTAKPYLE